MAKSKLKYFKIFGEKIKIIPDETIEQHGFAGLYLPDKKEIRLSKHKNEKELLETAVHELGHAVCHITGLRQSTMSVDVEEIFVENISKAIVENFDIKFKK